MIGMGNHQEKKQMKFLCSGQMYKNLILYCMLDQSKSAFYNFILDASSKNYHAVWFNIKSS